MKRYILKLIIIFVSLNLNVLIAQVFESRNKILIKVEVEVHKDSVDLFKYCYKIQSSSESQQKIWYFMVILKFHPSLLYNKSEIIGWWGPDIPDESPFWISWSAPNNHQIEPGDSLNGLCFNTHLILLPGLTDYYAEGYTPPPYFEDSANDDTIPGYDDLTPYGPGIVGKTVGPVLTPDPFIALAFLDTIASYKHQALDLGWIDNQGIANSLDQKLENVKKQLEKGKIKQAINILNAFLNEVEAQKYKHLTSEAYALLKYNAEYLIQRLEED